MPRVALEPDLSPDDSITVAQAARRLGCDPTTVRALIREGSLSGHRVGKGKTPNGVRIKLWSVIEYEERHAFGRREPANDAGKPKPRRDPNPAHGEAMAYLRSLGLDL